MSPYRKGYIQKPAGRAAVVFQEDRLCPEEDAVTNVSMVCTKAVSEEEIRNMLAEVLPAQELTAPQRKGFTVVEWGGAQVQ